MQYCQSLLLHALCLHAARVDQLAMCRDGQEEEAVNEELAMPPGSPVRRRSLQQAQAPPPRDLLPARTFSGMSPVSSVFSASQNASLRIAHILIEH